MTALKPSKFGVLLINLGTPESPEPEAVGRYLKQFLMDKWVVDIPWPLRWFLVNTIIVPRRKHASAELYRSIWTQKGSPLLIHSRDFERGLKETLGLPIELAMRYGKPSIEEATRRLLASGIDELVIFPLYPQYAESTTRSSLEEARAVLNRLVAGTGRQIQVRIVPPFYREPSFIEAQRSAIEAAKSGESFDHFLFTFHGLPVRHVKKTDPSRVHCLKGESCCSIIGEGNLDCYRAQCFATARELAKSLKLPADAWSVSFQSRLGRSEWIKPYTEETIRALAMRGVKRLAVVAPSFTADCLETLEEIAVRGAEVFHAAGGERYVTFPCVNSDPSWVASARELIERAIAEPVHPRAKST